MGVSAGEGMIHYVLLTRDDVGRSVVDTRVIDVDRSDGLDVAGRVNAGIDLMLGAARDADRRVGPIGVAARTAKQRRELASRGSGPRRQIHLVDEGDAVVAYLAATGRIDRFASVVVADCGDTGMSLYTVDPASQRISAPMRSRALAGRDVDRAIVAELIADDPSRDSNVARGRRSALLSACRAAKEEVTPLGDDSVVLTDGRGHPRLTNAVVERALAPMVDEARAVITRYLSESAVRDARPDAVVLVGGIANLPAVRAMLDTTAVEVVVPDTPELAASVGAAILARAQTSAATSRLAFIGGRRNREWLSATPLAVVGAILAAATMTIYAVSSSLAGHNAPVPSPIPPAATSSVESETSSTTAESSTTTTTVVAPQPQAPQAQPEPMLPTTQHMSPRWDESPGWATTELPPTTESDPSTSAPTRTLLPYPLPSLPWPTGTRPTPPIPEFIPPGLLPESSVPTTPVPPRSAAPTTTPPAPRLAAPSGAAPVSSDPPATTPPLITTPTR
ncbi:MAG: Hsp70 family protein [Actinomycetota bacterium]|nr:Hsp70 family protein [Actinomycetota bacterium]